MDTNSDLQQTITFIGGMDSDTPDLYLNGTTYREAVNMRLGIDEEGVGVLRAIPSFAESDKLQLQLGTESPWQIVQTFEFRDENVHILRNGEYWCIVLCNGDDLDHANRILKAKQSDWEIGEGDKVSVTFSYESVDNQKMYLANGKQPMLIVPLNYVSQGDLFVFDTNDINKLISYPAALLLPVKIDRITSGNLTCGRVLYSYRLYNKYLGATEAAMPTRQFHVVHYKGSGLQTRGGNVGEQSNMGLGIEISIGNQHGQFEYILIFRIQYTDPGQPAQVHVVYDGKVSGSTIKFVDDSLESLDQMSVAEFNSLSGVHIIPLAIDNKEDRLFAANIKETDTCIVDEIVKDYDTRAFRFTIGDSPDSPVIANLYQYQQRQNPTKITVNLSSQVDNGLFLGSTVLNIPDYNHDCDNPYNDINSISVTIGTGVEKYDVGGFYGGTGRNISYRFVIGDIIGDSNVSENELQYGHRASVLATDDDLLFDILGELEGISVRPITSSGGTGELEEDTYKHPGYGNSYGITYSNPFVSSSMPSLHRDEIYRYGIIFYDADGNKSSVKWIGDIRTPMLRECCVLGGDKYYYPYRHKWRLPFQTVDYSNLAAFSQNYEINNTAYELVVHPIGILFYIRNIPTGIARYEIVRAKMQQIDRHNISQGILFNVGINLISQRYNKQSFRYSQSFPSITEYWSYDSHNNLQGMQKSDITNSLYQFASPDSCYTDSFKLGNKLQPIFLVFSNGRVERKVDGERIVSPAETGFSLSYSLVDPSDEESTGAWRLEEKCWYDNGWHYNTIMSLYYLLLASIDAEKVVFGYANPVKITSSDQQYNSYHSLIALYDSPEEILNNDAKTITKNSYAYLKFYGVADGSYIGQISNDDENFAKDVWFSTDNADLDKSVVFDINNYVSLNNYVLSWNSLSDNSGTINSKLVYEDKSVAIGQFAFVNFFASGTEGDNQYEPLEQIMPSSKLSNNKLVGPGGDGALLLLNTQIFAGYKENEDDETPISYRESANSEFGPILCNIQHWVQPYGGVLLTSRRLTSYSSYCDYCDVDNLHSMYIHTVFDGDTYILPFEYVSLHKWYDPYELAGNKVGLKQMVVSSTPVETSIDFVYSHGNEFSANASNIATNLQEKPANVNNIYIQENSLYKYNDTYTGLDSASSYVAFDEDRLNSDINQDCRIYASEIKMPNEAIDNWRIFKPANYIDVESKYGEITNIRNFRNNLVYWQVDAMGVASVNERQILTSDSNEQLVIGSGGVLSRYDYVSTQYGMKQKSFNDALSDSALYWVDVNRAAILAYNGQVDNIARNKKVQTYINNENQSFDNPQTYYNPNSKEVLFDGMKSAKATQCLLSMDPNEYEDAQGYSFSLIYNEELQSFTSILLTDENSTMSIENQTNPYNWSIKLVSHIGQDDYYLAVNKCVGDVQDSSVTTTVNKGSLYTKVFDNMELDIQNRENLFDFDHLYDSTMSIIFLTSLGQRAKFEDQILNDREYNRRIAIPRSNTYDEQVQQSRNFGDRLRGRTMNVLIKPSIDQLYNNCAPSLSCITTKFRMSLA